MDSAKARELWDATLGNLQLQVTRPYYETYLKNTVGLEYEDGRFLVGVPTTFVVEWLHLRMRARIEEALKRITNRAVHAEFVVYQNPRDTTHSLSQRTIKNLSGGPSIDNTVDARRPTTDSVEEDHGDVPLNHKYTFDNFIVGGFNRMAHAAAWAVVKAPGVYYNPLFIYSSLGLGKTHLLHAIAHAALLNRKTVVYVSAEQFTHDLITTLRDKTSHLFRDKYRNVDLLLVDDIQFISGKEHTQEVFYHTFNYLHNANKQIVIAGDSHPRAIPVMDPRLVSRFEGGLLVDMSVPDLEARFTILETKANNHSVRVDGEVLDVIARQVQDSIRQLEGALNRVIAYAGSSGSPITPQLATTALSGTPHERTSALAPTTIIESVAAYFHIDPEELRGKKRNRNIVEARHITMYLLREELKLSPMRIGALLGHRTPTSVNMSIRKIISTIPTNTKMHTDISLIKDSIFSPSSTVTA